MRILWFLDKEFDVAHNISARLATIKYLERRNEVVIVTNYKKQKIYPYDIKCQIVYLDRIDIPILKSVSFYIQHLKFLKKGIDLNKIDVIFINSNNFFLLEKLIKKKNICHYKLILDIRSLPVETNLLKRNISNLLFKKSIKIAAEHFDGISYITEEMKGYLENKFKLPEHTSSTWGSGVDIAIFMDLRKPTNDQKLRLIYHGKVARNRHIQNVIKALYILRDYEIEFSVIGSIEEMSELKDLTHKLKLRDRIYFHPVVPHKEIPDYISRMDLGILPFPDWPGWNTSSPIKLFEYLACGKPVIVTKIPALFNLLEGKNFAFWADTSSPKDLSKAILNALSSKKHFKKLGREARDFILKNYSWERELSKLESFLME